MDQLAKLGPMQGLIKFWGALNGTQKFITAVFIATSVVLLVVVGVFATKPKMVVLFAGLQPEDAGAVVSKLQETKVAYEVDGSSIKVPEKDAPEVRMQLAGQGLPQGGNAGFELFDKSSFGMTEFTQKVTYIRAIQGELSRAIDTIHNVAGSKVQISMPEESVFSEKEKQPKASVLLKLRPGARVGDEQVAGIVHLVSSAVDGLEPNMVSIMDTSGNLLSEGSDDPNGLDPRMNASQLKLKRQYERTVEQDIQSMLERVLGADKAIVRANAKINFDRKEESKETYEPSETNKGQGILVSEEKTDESYNNAAPGALGASGGLAGVRGNTRPTAIVTEAGSQKGYKRIQSSSKYEVSKTTQHIVTAPGQVENMCVAVMVDGKLDAGIISSIEKVVSTAAGIDTAKGDKITVESMAFDDSAKKEEKKFEAEASKSGMMATGKTVAGVLLLFGFLFFLKGMLKGIKISVPEASTVQEVTPLEAASALQGFDSTSMQQSRPPAMSNAAEAQPQDIAQALRRWMQD